jgi:hypothetical protein
MCCASEAHCGGDWDWWDSTASRDHLEAGFKKLEQERQSVYQHVRSLESYKELNKDMLVGESCPMHLCTGCVDGWRDVVR